ncbi:ABC transporter permease subunit [Stomatohabitans albus]|uniref:amino acid ABC transporter permease n=1 Tax=Stomatohabitans albus TaxID=3110766 RepID=UPI00300C7328
MAYRWRRYRHLRTLNQIAPPSLTGPVGSRRWRVRTLLNEEGAIGVGISVISTVVVGAIIAAAVLNSPTWPVVRDQFFSLEHMVNALPNIWRGFVLDMQLFVIAQLAIFLLSIIIAGVRSLRGPVFFPLRVMAIVYIDLFRGIPLILAILLLGFGVPALQIPWLPNSELFWGVTTLVLSYSAYTAEVIRSGIESVPESQRLAARSIGLTQMQALRHAILPQAIRNVVPALLNGVVSLQKDVALISVLGVREAVREAGLGAARTFNYSGYVVAALLFLAVSVPLARFADYWAARTRAQRSGTLV